MVFFSKKLQDWFNDRLMTVLDELRLFVDRKLDYYRGILIDGIQSIVRAQESVYLPEFEYLKGQVKSIDTKFEKMADLYAKMNETKGAQMQTQTRLIQSLQDENKALKERNDDILNRLLVFASKPMVAASIQPMTQTAPQWNSMNLFEPLPPGHEYGLTDEERSLGDVYDEMAEIVGLPESDDVEEMED